MIQKKHSLTSHTNKHTLASSAAVRLKLKTLCEHEELKTLRLGDKLHDILYIY